MWNSAASQIERELDQGGRILWSGQPRGGLRLRSSDMFAIPFSILWCGFAIFWEINVIRRDAPFFFMIRGIPFVLVGLYVVIGRFFVDVHLRGRTYYGVANDRIIIVGLGFRAGREKAIATRHQHSMK